MKNAEQYIENSMSKIEISEEASFRTMLAIGCLIIGTILSLLSAFISSIPLFIGVLIALTGLILFLVDAIFRSNQI